MLQYYCMLRMFFFPLSFTGLQTSQCMCGQGSATASSPQAIRALTTHVATPHPHSDAAGAV